MRKLLLFISLLFAIHCAMAQHPIQNQNPEGLPHAGITSQQINDANNPLAKHNSIGFQDYYAPTLFDLPNQAANSFMVRPVVVTPRMIFRVTVPVNTVPVAKAPMQSGLSDINMFITILLTNPTAKIDVGIGPQVYFPTATTKELGTGKWQAGLAGVVVYPGKSFLIGSLITWQMSFAGDKSRTDVNSIDFQPFYVFQFGSGFFVKGTAIWTFDLVNGYYNIPFGLGIGKSFLVGKTVFSIGLEPQFSVAHWGAGQSQFQLFGGLSMQFAHKDKDKNKKKKNTNTDPKD